MKKFLAITLMAVSTTGCAMTPEQREAMAAALQQIGNNYQQQAYQNQQQSYQYYQQSNDAVQQMRDREIMQKLDQLQYDQRNGCNGWIGDGAAGMPDC